MDQKRLRVLQVGCGGRAQSHLSAMIAAGAVEIVALCELNADKLKSAGEKFGVMLLGSDMSALIRDTQPELVNIVTPPTLRMSIVEPAIEAGAPAILIEKPLALTPSEARQLEALGRERLIAVNTQYQWMPHWKRFWTMLENRELGEVRLLRAATGVNILEQGPHILDLVLKAATLSGLPDPEWVLAGASGLERFGTLPVPANISATIGSGEARLHLNCGPCAPMVEGETNKFYQQQIEVIGERGRLWVSLNRGWTLWRDGHFESGATMWPRDDQAAQPALFEHLRAALHEEDGETWRQFPTRIEVAARRSDVLFACYDSALRRRRVEVGAELGDNLLEELEALKD